MNHDRRRPIAPALLLAGLALAATSAHAAALAGKRVDDHALAGQRGGADVVSDASLKGVVSDNQAINVTTGGNRIGGGALAGMAGVPVVIQNTGNNVVIQSSTIVNLQLK